MILRGPRDFQKLVMRSGRDPEARKALLARNAARELAFNTESKIEKLKEILNKHREDRIFILRNITGLSTEFPGNFLSLQSPTERLQKKGIPSSRSSRKENTGL